MQYNKNKRKEKFSIKTASLICFNKNVKSNFYDCKKFMENALCSKKNTKYLNSKTKYFNIKITHA